MARSKSRLSTEALEHIAGAVPAHADDSPEHVSVDVRKITNGFVSTHSRSKNGEYSSKEEFHAKRPQIEEILGAERKRGEVPSVNHLKAATSYLRRK